MSTTLYTVGQVYEVTPDALKIGTNVRIDTHPKAKDFAASIGTAVELVDTFGVVVHAA